MRSVAWTVFLIPFLILPYRWLWLPMGLAIRFLVAPPRRSRRDALRADGTLILGAPLVLVLRTALDPLWWAPMAVIFAVLFRLRASVTHTSRRAGLLALIGWIAAIALLARPEWPRSTPSSSAVPRDAVLVLAGDSLTAGTDINSDAQTYVARLRERLPCTVINAGVANDETRDLLVRCDRDVVAHHPTVVVVFIGGNDYLHGVSRGVFATALDSLLAKLQRTGARLVLVEVPTGIVWNPFAGVYRHAAAKYGAALVPESQLRWRFGLDILARNHLANPFTCDGIHLSATGATEVGDMLEPFILQALAQSRCNTNVLAKAGASG